jgi:hypothetical protein
MLAEMVTWQPPGTGSRPVPIGSNEAIKCAAQLHCKDSVQALTSRLVVVPALVVSAANPSVLSTLRAGCHFYLAPTNQADFPESNRMGLSHFLWALWVSHRRIGAAVVQMTAPAESCGESPLKA